MIDVTVKTLDSQNHVFAVEEDITVRQFKEQISPTIAIPVDQQRLIFRGRVLQDDKKISEYNVANNTIHVVQRPANQNSTSNDEPPARPSSQAGNRMGDAGGIFLAADDGAGGGGGRNAIIMGAIGLPTFDVEGGQGDDMGHQPRRSGAQVRLMVGNQMLNRASNLLQQLEDDDSAVVSIAASSSPSSSASVSGSGDHDSPENEIAGLLNNDSPMDIDDDAGSIERMISQVVNVSSAAALVAAIRQVQPGASGSNPPSSPAPPTQQAPGNSTDSPSAEATTATTSAPSSTTAPVTGAAPTLPVPEANQNQNQQASPSRRPESPRIRELSTALQDYLALQDRLTPFLRFLQDALRQNRLYTETGESQSTQFVFDTVSSILHLLGHSLHAFSEIMCDFSLPPEDRRLIASSSILVEQSTVVRATIPVAVPAAAMLANASAAAAANAGAGATVGNATAGGTTNNAQQPGGNQQVPTGFSFQMGPPTSQAGGAGGGSNPYSPFTAGITGIPGLAISMSAAPGVPLTNIGPVSGIPVSIPGFPTGLIPTQINRQWTNSTTPPTNTSTTTASSGQQPSANSQQPTQQQQPSQQPSMQLPGGGMLPPGLHNLGALLGVGGAGGFANLFGAGGLGAAGGMPAGMQNPFLNFQMPQAASNNNNNNNAAAPNTGSAAPASGQQATPNSNSTANGGDNSPRQGGMGNNNGGGGMLQNLLRNELNRPQFDVLLPCHTHHTSGRARSSNRSRPAEFRRFVNVEGGAVSDTTIGNGVAEGETVEILIDLIRNSRLIDLLQPLLKDAVLNYLMRGRDPKNPVHVKTCAKGLVKKILPFLVKFSTKIGGANESVDISATYLNILTGFLTSLMQKVIGQSAAGDGHFKTELINSLTDLQKQLILAFKVCYPNSTNVGLLFVDYLVEQCLGGMSIIFKNQVRQKLIDYLKQLETKIDNSSSFIVYKESPQPAAPAPAATPSPIESSGNTLPSTTASAVATNLLSSRCAASFGNTSSSSSLTSGIATEASSSGGSTPSKVLCTIPTPPPVASAPPMNLSTDDVDIDEVLQLPPSMATAGPQQDGAAARRCLHSGGANAQGHSNHQTDSISSLMRSLPSEWADTVQQDIRRQVEMPSQQAFSPGYNTLFPRKH